MWLCRLPRDIDSRATITIGSESFEVEATDLESIEIMGRGAYGVVERMRHRPSDTVMAVKVRSQLRPVLDQLMSDKSFTLSVDSAPTCFKFD